MRIVGIYWSRLVGPVIGLTAFVLMFRWGGGFRGLIFGGLAFIAACWWGEWGWYKQASEQERRLALEDRVRNPPE